MKVLAQKNMVKETVRKLALILSLSTFSLSAYQVLQHWDYDEILVDIEKSLRLNVTQKKISQEIHNSISNAEFDDARMYIAIAESNHYEVDSERLKNFISQKDTQLRKVITQATNFTQGFIKGKSANVAGISGSVVADFTVVGDVRDLSHEYEKHEKGEEINEVIVLLSGAGVGLTALTVASLGTVAPAKAGTSIIKLAVKTHRMTRSFQKHIVKLGRKVFDWPLFSRLLKQNRSVNNIRHAARQAYHPEAIKPLKKIASQVNRIRKSTSTIDTVHLLKYVESPNDLRKLEKISLKYGTKTKGLMKLVGKGALRTVRVLRKTTALILSLLATALSGLLSFLFLFRAVFK